ncbi:UPF0225 protein YchJ [hydrothermal vent metagenome]|uniref:UPF0225 protein YchJ n=1 Tax=hydrothermal vent metagenome TaxID=652676 RepID=A0A1W1B9V3_9ZZZZ
MKISPNATCPCHSKKKYKRCCAKYHKGAIAKNSLELMRSRYSAYALGDSKYIIKTTHPENPDYTLDTDKWSQSIDIFTQQSSFDGLEILEWIDGERESYVSFRATISNTIMIEKSRFVKESGRWLYVDGVLS